MRTWRVAVVLILIVLATCVVYGLILLRHGFSARDNPSALETAVARAMRLAAIPSGAKDQKNPVPATPEVLQEGMAHFADHCAICHANDGSGRTEIGRNLYPKAPDMRQPETQNLTDGELYYIIHNGIRLTGMPAWGESAEDLDSWKLVHFIRHLSKLTPQEELEMERLNPKSPAERSEEQEEEEFLKGGEPPQQHHHNHN